MCTSNHRTFPNLKNIQSFIQKHAEITRITRKYPEEIAALTTHIESSLEQLAREKNGRDWSNAFKEYQREVEKIEKVSEYLERYTRATKPNYNDGIRKVK